VLTALWTVPTALVALLAASVTAVGGVQAAEPQSDPPPVQVTPGGTFLPQGESTLTLTLDAAGGAGDLEPGAVQAIQQAAAKITASQSRSGADTSSQDAGDVASNESSATESGSGVSAGECAWRDASAAPPTDAAWGGNDPSTGTLFVNICNGPTRYVFVPGAAPGALAAAPPPPDPAVLAQQAYGELTLPKPTAKRSPDEGNSDPQNGGLPYTWTNLWTWVWAAEWQTLARTVDLRGVSATVTATPTALIFDPGDGSAPITCPGRGRPWTTVDGSDPPSAGGCGHMYRAVTPAGPLTATTSIQWSVAWTSNVGVGGTFPALTTQTTSSFLVEQIQVVTR
jgi:hypothetical protein